MALQFDSEPEIYRIKVNQVSCFIYRFRTVVTVGLGGLVGLGNIIVLGNSDGFVDLVRKLLAVEDGIESINLVEN